MTTIYFGTADTRSQHVLHGIEFGRVYHIDHRGSQHIGIQHSKRKTRCAKQFAIDGKLCLSVLIQRKEQTPLVILRSVLCQDGGNHLASGLHRQNFSFGSINRQRAYLYLHGLSVTHIEGFIDHNTPYLFLYIEFLGVSIGHGNTGIALHLIANNEIDLVNQAQVLSGTQSHSRSVSGGVLLGNSLCIEEFNGSILYQRFLAARNQFQAEVVGGEQVRFHVLGELHFHTFVVSLGLHHFGLCILHHANVHFELRRRNG